MFSTLDQYWMKRTLALAQKGMGQTRPNPMVGAIVLDSQGRFVSKAYHQKAGEAHAERIALEIAGDRAKGGTLYVSLEPCCHVGKTPPCTEAVLQAKVRRVVVASVDPNPLVSGQGVTFLRKNNIQVDVGLLTECERQLNAVFRKWIVTKKPFVLAKAATSLDGIMGDSTKRLLISGSSCQYRTMKIRSAVEAIIVGESTVRIDQPHLGLRGPKYKDYSPGVKVIVSSSLQFPLSAPCFAEPEKVWILCPEAILETPPALLAKERGMTLIGMKSKQCFIDPSDILLELAKRDISSILLEGGPTLLEQFFTKNLIDQWLIYLRCGSLAALAPEKNQVRFSFTSPFSLSVQSVISRGPDLELWTKPLAP